MSYIDVHVYSGDAEDYQSLADDTPENIGEIVEEHSFSDGEELMGAEYILGLLDRARHFDVRHTVN